MSCQYKREEQPGRVNLFTTALWRCLGVISFTLRKALVMVVFHDRVRNLTGCLIRCRSFFVELASKEVPRLPRNGSGIQIFGMLSNSLR